jgi:hypothetical protein
LEEKTMESQTSQKLKKLDKYAGSYHCYVKVKKGHTFNSTTSLLLASKPFFKVSTSDDCAPSVGLSDDGSDVFVSAFASAASEYHLAAILPLDSWKAGDRRRGDERRRGVDSVLDDIFEFIDLDARRTFR